MVSLRDETISNYEDRLRSLMKDLNPHLQEDGIEYHPHYHSISAVKDGRVFAFYGEFGIALKLSAPVLARLYIENHAAPLRHRNSGLIRKGFGILSDRVLSDKNRSKRLLEHSMYYTGL